MKADAPSCTVDVRDLKVLVTAGGSGIGRAIAERLIEAGARVHITDEMFDRTVSHLVDTLAGLQVDPEVIDEVVIRLAAQRGQVVTRLPVGGGELPTA